MGNDNWKHRSDGMQCGTCVWWVPKVMMGKDATKATAGPEEAGIGK